MVSMARTTEGPARMALARLCTGRALAIPHTREQYLTSIQISEHSRPRLACIVHTPQHMLARGCHVRACSPNKVVIL